LMIMPFFFASIITCIVTLAIVVVFLMLAQVPFRAVKPFTSIFYTLVPMMMIAWVFFSRHGTTIFAYGPISVTDEGIFSGALNVVKLVVMVLATGLLLTTTSQRDIIAGFRKLKLPYSLCLMFALALRFIPSVYNDYEQVKSAQMSRGFEFEKEKLVTKAIKFTTILIPMLVISIQKVEYLSIALDSRGLRLGRNVVRTFYKDPQLNSREYGVLGSAIMLVIAILTFKYVFHVLL